MMNNVLLEMTKTMNAEYEKTIVYKDGKVIKEIFKNGEISTLIESFDFVRELDEQLTKAYDIMVLIYDKENNETFKVTYNNHNFFSFDLFIDINLMIKKNQIFNLSVFKKYEKEKEKLERENKLIEDIKVLNDLENKKNILDISNLDDNFEFVNERKIISFDLKGKVDFGLGESRFFSDTIDISDDVEIPKQLEFVGQLNLNDITKYDVNNLLPKNRMLYFFQSPYVLANHVYEFGKVIYSSNMDLKRKKLEINKNNKDMILNLSLNKIENTIEKFEDRYMIYDGKEQYDSFAKDDLNKIYGFYTDCQMLEKDVKKVSAKYIVLLQLGSNIFGEGVTTFLISKSDLINGNFDNVIYKYVQS